jgi:DNA-binding Lrp family transcriptional regulator
MAIQKAYVLIKTDPGHEKEVADHLMKLDEVNEVHIITGEWDLLAVVQTEKGYVVPTDEKVLNVVMDKITRVGHIRDTNTIIPSFSKYKS